MNQACIPNAKPTLFNLILPSRVTRDSLYMELLSVHKGILLNFRSGSYASICNASIDDVFKVFKCIFRTYSVKLLQYTASLFVCSMFHNN